MCGNLCAYDQQADFFLSVLQIWGTLVIDKNSGTTVFRAEETAGINEVLIWKDEGCISVVLPRDENEVADFIDNPEAELVARSSKAKNRKVTVLENGPARSTLKVEYNLDWGLFVQKISLEAGSRVIRFSTEVLWNPEERIKQWSSETGNKVGFRHAESFRRITLKPVEDQE